MEHPNPVAYELVTPNVAAVWLWVTMISNLADLPRAGLEFVDPYSMLFDGPFISWYPNDEILFFLAKPPFLLYLVEINNPTIHPFFP